MWREKGTPTKRERGGGERETLTHTGLNTNTHSHTHTHANTHSHTHTHTHKHKHKNTNTRSFTRHPPLPLFWFCLTAPVDKQHVVAGIEPEGPAFGLLEVGDVIEAINAINTRNLSRHAVPRIIGKKQVLNLRIQRMPQLPENGSSGVAEHGNGTGTGTGTGTALRRRSSSNIVPYATMGTPMQSVVDELRQRAATPRKQGESGAAQASLPGTTPMATAQTHQPVQASEPSDRIVPVGRQQANGRTQPAAAPGGGGQFLTPQGRAHRVPSLDFSVSVQLEILHLFFSPSCI